MRAGKHRFCRQSRRLLLERQHGKVGKLILVIGNKNYSSWSLRPWLLLCQAGIACDAVRKLPAMRAWLAAAREEQETIPQLEPYG